MRTQLVFALLLTLPLYGLDCEDPGAAQPDPHPDFAALHSQILQRAGEERKHRLAGLASYYSTSLDGTLTANGERYRNKRLSAAHLTIPLGTWIVVRSRATGKRVRLRVNDRGPYSKFTIDLSQAAARAIGVDVAEDRSVNIWFVDAP
jgi:rare lipoprotein A (peptidoglycan hydrolase)